MEFNVIINELENDRNWLIEEREEILSELAGFRNMVVHYERKIKVGELINITDFEKHPKYVALLKERDDLVTIMNASNVQLNESSSLSNNISYADIIKTGIGKVAITHNRNLNLSKVIINKTNPGIRIQSICKKRIANTVHSVASSRSLDQLKVQYKLINIDNTTIEHLQEKLNDEHRDYNMQVNKIYKVSGDHKSYNNAIIIVNMNTAAKFEENPYLYYNNCRLRVFELFHLRQCTNCWEYSHYKSSCKNNARCKICGEKTHNSNQECLPKCKACYEKGFSYDHIASSYKCTTRDNLINEEKSKSFLA